MLSGFSDAIHSVVGLFVTIPLVTIPHAYGAGGTGRWEESLIERAFLVKCLLCGKYL